MTVAVICSQCGVQLAHNPRRKGTMCKPCTARARVTSDAHRQAAAAAMARRWADPHEAAKLVAGLKRALATPEARAQRRAQGIANYQTAGDRMREASQRPEARAKAGRSCTERRLARIPMHLRGEYRRLRVNHKLSAAEATRMILDQVAHDVARYQRTGELPEARRREAEGRGMK